MTGTDATSSSGSVLGLTLGGQSDSEYSARRLTPEDMSSMATLLLEVGLSSVDDESRDSAVNLHIVSLFIIARLNLEVLVLAVVLAQSCVLVLVLVARAYLLVQYLLVLCPKSYVLDRGGGTILVAGETIVSS